MSRSLIEVHTAPAFMPQQSNADLKKFFFAYTITITNLGERSCQLLSRHWVITNAEGDTREVKGDGVIGKQPTLLSGESFTYTSGAMLETPVGTMEGSYQFADHNQSLFNVPIKAFLLAVPGAVN